MLRIKNLLKKGDNTMAQEVFLTLKIDGNDIVGTSTVFTLDREASIECLSFYYGLIAHHDLKSGRLTGRPQQQEVRIHKYIDMATPRLLSALCLSKPVDRAEFRFFRPSPVTADDENYFTLLLENGYITSLKLLDKDSILDNNQTSAMTEEVTFAFRKATWTYEIGDVTHSDICWERENNSLK